MKIKSLIAHVLTVSTLLFGLYPSSSYAKNKHEVFLNTMIDIMEQHSIFREELNWQAIRAEILGAAAGIETFDEREHLIYRTLELIKTNHTSVRNTQSGQYIFHAKNRCNMVEEVPLKDLPSSIGYVHIGAHQSGDVRDNRAFAQSLMTKIKTQDRHTLNAWVLDLRSNSGGNMYPMLAGLSPFFEDGMLGYFLQSSPSEELSFSHQKGLILYKNKPVIQLQEYELNNNTIPVYVLLSNTTSSSGEAVAIALRTSKNTVFVGGKTCGRTTGNRKFTLPEGYEMFLTVSLMADKNKQTYPDGLSPDSYMKTEDILDLIKKVALGME